MWRTELEGSTYFQQKFQSERRERRGSKIFEELMTETEKKKKKIKHKYFQPRNFNVS